MSDCRPVDALLSRVKIKTKVTPAYAPKGEGHWVAKPDKPELYEIMRDREKAKE